MGKPSSPKACPYFLCPSVLPVHPIKPIPPIIPIIILISIRLILSNLPRAL